MGGGVRDWRLWQTVGPDSATMSRKNAPTFPCIVDPWFWYELQQVFVLVGKARMKAKSDSGSPLVLSPARRQICRIKSINRKVRKRYLGLSTTHRQEGVP